MLIRMGRNIHPDGTFTIRGLIPSRIVGEDIVATMGDDSGHARELEETRGLRFWHRPFKESQNLRSWAHCSACGRDICEHGRARGKLGLSELLKMQVKSKIDRLLAF